MKYSLIQIEEQYHLSSDVYRTDGKTTFVTRKTFRLILTGMTLEEAQTERSKIDHPEWYIIIQVW